MISPTSQYIITFTATTNSQFKYFYFDSTENNYYTPCTLYSENIDKIDLTIKPPIPIPSFPPNNIQESNDQRVTVNINSDSTIESVIINNNPYTYTNLPFITIPPPSSNLLYSYIIENSNLTSLTITNYFRIIPELIFTDPLRILIPAQANISLSTTEGYNIKMICNGNGYIACPTITLIDYTPLSANIYFVVNNDMTVIINKVYLVNGGYNNIFKIDINFSKNPFLLQNTKYDFTCTIDDSQIINISLNDNYKFSQSQITANINNLLLNIQYPFVPPTLNIELNSNKLNIIVEDGGFGCDNNLLISSNNDNFIQALVETSFDINNKLLITVINPGFGYTSPLIVNLPLPKVRNISYAGYSPNAYATIMNGQITNISIDNNGNDYGYQIAPTITIQSPIESNGSPQITLTPTIKNTIITDIQLNYNYPLIYNYIPTITIENPLQEFTADMINEPETYKWIITTTFNNNTNNTQNNYTYKITDIPQIFNNIIYSDNPRPTYYFQNDANIKLKLIKIPSTNYYQIDNDSIEIINGGYGFYTNNNTLSFIQEDINVIKQPSFNNTIDINYNFLKNIKINNNAEIEISNFTYSGEYLYCSLHNVYIPPTINITLTENGIINQVDLNINIPNLVFSENTNFNIFIQPNNSQAKVETLFDINNSLSFNIVNGGSGYNLNNFIYTYSPLFEKAEATSQLINDTIIVTITNPGINYTYNNIPLVTLSLPTPIDSAVIDCINNNNNNISFNIKN